MFGIEKENDKSTAQLSVGRMGIENRLKINENVFLEAPI